MAIDIHSVGNSPTYHTEVQQKLAGQAEMRQMERQMKADDARRRSAEQYINDILNYTSMFNRRLRFSVNQELDQVIVKVVDAETDKVIKEIPPEVLQRLHVRLREAIGLLIDEMI